MGGSDNGISFSARRHIDKLRLQAITLRQPIGVDASALIHFLENRPGYAPLLSPIFREVEPRIVISAVTLAEILAHPARGGEWDRLRRLRQAVLGLPGLVVVPLDAGTATRAAVTRGTTGLKLPDAAMIAAAQSMDACAVIGNDRVWKNRELGMPYHHLDDILTLE